MEAFLTSAAAVAMAEIGDKTMLLAIVLAARFRRPMPIIAGILFATLANHFLAALLGAQAAAWFAGPTFRYLVAAGFIAMAIWTLVPDKLDDEENPAEPRFGAFLTTLVAFFLVEIGDKTQIATIALGARYADTLVVTAGTTAGMMLANVPAVLLGERATKIMPLRTMRLLAAGLFLIIGLSIAAQAAGLF